MSIASYSDLLTAVANWTMRADLTSRIPEGIVLAEAKMNRYLKTRSMVTKNASFSINGEYVAVPTNFGGVRNFYLGDSDTDPLVFMPDEQMAAAYQGTSGEPNFYCVQGSNFRFAPVPDATYTATLVYYLYVPALTVSNTTNWVITSHPDAYLYGVMGEMEAFAKNFQAAQGWEGMFYRVMDEMRSQSRSETWGDSGLQTRVDSSTP